MTSTTDPITHIVASLTYYDNELGKEYILTKEGLCSRVGCKCTQWGPVCNNFEYEYFNTYIHHFYRSFCLESCGCMKVKPTLIDGANVTSFAINGTRVTTSPSSLKTTAIASGNCLAGEAAGWTTEQQAKCCWGYHFQPLTPKQVYDLYGLVPSASGFGDTAVTIGVCSSRPLTSDVSVA